MKLYFDQTPYQSPVDEKIIIELDTIEDPEKCPEMTFEMPMKRLAEAYAKQFPIEGEQGFYEAKEYNDTAWSKWVIGWVEFNIFNLNRDVETRMLVLKSERDSLSEVVSKSYLLVEDKNREIRELKAELEELRGFKAAQIVKEKVIEINEYHSNGTARYRRPA